MLRILGLDSIAAEVVQPTYFVKCLISDNVVAFFPGTYQHAEFHVATLRYEDGSQGNALAGTVNSRRFAIRPHAAYSCGRVALIVRELLRSEGTAWLKGIPVYYGDQLVE
jgi:hypothetical protein